MKTTIKNLNVGEAFTVPSIGNSNDVWKKNGLITRKKEVYCTTNGNGRYFPENTKVERVEK